jgi:hypothetical protein
MKNFCFTLSNLLLMCATLCAQQPCQDELNAANVELTKKRTQEQEWEQERKKMLDSIKIFGRLRIDHQLLSQDYNVLKSKVADVGNIDKAMYDRLVENQEKMNSLLKKTTEEVAVAQAQKEQIEIQLKTCKDETESLKKDTTICRLRTKQTEEENSALKTTQQKLLESFKKDTKMFEDSLNMLHEELRDRITFKSFESKTGRKFPEGVYFGNKNHAFSDGDQAEVYYPFDAPVLRVLVNLEKEKNKFVLTPTLKYGIQRICKTLYRYVPACKLRLKVHYPATILSNSNINTKKSAEFAAAEMLAFLNTQYDFLMNEAKIEVKYVEYSVKKEGENPSNTAKCWIDFCILD